MAVYARRLTVAEGRTASVAAVTQARQLGANAVIATDLDYESLTMDNSGGMLMVTAAGTAIIYEA